MSADAYKRLLDYAGKRRSEVRNPNITAREAIYIADTIESLRAQLAEVTAELGAVQNRLLNQLAEKDRECERLRSATSQIIAAAHTSRLFNLFARQGFWHAHHVDLVWRFDGRDEREEADWIKSVWYAIRALENDDG